MNDEEMDEELEEQQSQNDAVSDESIDDTTSSDDINTEEEVDDEEIDDVEVDETEIDDEEVDEEDIVNEEEVSDAEVDVEGSDTSSDNENVDVNNDSSEEGYYAASDEANNEESSDVDESSVDDSSEESNDLDNTEDIEGIIEDESSDEDEDFEPIDVDSYTTDFAQRFANFGASFAEGGLVYNFCKWFADFWEEHFATGDSSSMYDYLSGSLDEDALNEAISASTDLDADELSDALGGAADKMNGIESPAVDTDNMTDEELYAYNLQQENIDNIVAMSDNIVANTVSDPVETADALKLFNDTAATTIEKAYQPGSEEYNQAFENLDNVMSSMTEDYYDALLDMESSGTRILTESEKDAINNLNLVGVEVSYGEYTSGMDVSQALEEPENAKDEHESTVESGVLAQNDLQTEDAVENMHVSDGSSYEDENLSDINSQVRNQIVSGSFLDSDSLEYDSSFQLSSENINSRFESFHDDIFAAADGTTDESVEDVANNDYMLWMQYLQAYNDEASKEIISYYGDDEESMQKATDGLANIMRNAVSETYSAMKEDDDALGFLSSEDKEVLDNMKFTGVNVSYSDYEDGMNLKTGKIENVSSEINDSDKMYGDAVDASGEWGEAEERFALTDEEESEDVGSLSNKGSRAEEELYAYSGVASSESSRDIEAGE